MIPVQAAKRLTILCLIAFIQIGCSKKTSIPKSDAQLGAEMQKAGIMSQTDYLKVGNLGEQTHQSHVISNADLEWTINLLKTSGNPIARARAMTVLSEIRPMSASQKAEVEPAIAPYINSSDRLDFVSAKRVEKAIKRN